jgi:uncharacterized membrane protein YsdA (DUF1294 family)
VQYLVYIVVINLAGFAAFGLDKSYAKAGKWRIPESTLLLLAIAGGSVGAYFGMKRFHHKTKHAQFWYGIPAIMVVQAAAIAIICIRLAFTQ